MQLVIASNNKGKIREIKAIFSRQFDPILSLKEVGIALDTIEDGDSFEANAMKKACEAAAVLKQHGIDAAVLSDDSGIEVEYLNGAPGIYSARYAGEPSDDERNNQKLIAALQGVPPEQRGARYVACVILLIPGEEPIVAHGYWAGQIALTPAGEGGFGYDPYFYLPEFGCTAAELSAQAKNRVSHRAKALQMLYTRYEAKKK